MMFDDLTKVNVPFGLLDRDTQEALKAHGGPYEMFGEVEWRHIASPGFAGGNTYRVIPTPPAPPTPREWWAVGLHLHKDETTARTFLNELNDEYPEMDFGPIIHVREVLPE